MAITLTAARTELENLKQDLSDVGSSLFISWANHVNRFAYRYIGGIDPERFISTQTFTNITTGAQALDDAQLSLQPMGCGVYLVDENGNDTQIQLPQLQFGSPRTGYYLDGSGNIQFLNVSTATTYKMRYMPALTVFADLGDYFTVDGTITGKEIIPDAYLLELRSALDVMYTQWDEDVPAESFSDARFARAIDEIARNIRRAPEVYAMPDMSLIY